MRRVALFLSAIFIFALQVAAQEPVPPYEISISPDECGFRFKPLGNSVNNDFVLFYGVVAPGGNRYVKACAIKPTGTRGTRYTLAVNYHLRKWDVVWHPVVKKFMLVYVKDGDIWAQRVKLNGMPSGPDRKVCYYPEDYFQIAWTKKKKFVLFLTRGGQLAAQALKKNGKKYKSEKNLTFFPEGEAYPVATDTKTNKEAVVYFAHYDGSANKLTPRLISVNHKLKIFDNYPITSAQDSGNKATFVGKYDPGRRVHSIAWRFGGAAMKKSRSKYCCFDESGTMVLPPTDTPENITPTALIYDPLMERFAIGYNKYATSAPQDPRAAGIERTYMYLTIYNPKGIIVTNELFVQWIVGEAPASGVSYAKNGNILGVMSYYGVTSSQVGFIKANLLQLH